MSRLVDADALKIPSEEIIAKIAVALAPTIDAVPVVRCKDCMYRDGNPCDYSAVYVSPNGYCQWGRREE